MGGRAVGAVEPIEVRVYGSFGPRVVMLHGGPGAPGSVASLAQCLSDEFRVLEPLQRRSGQVPLNVERHVEDLAAVMPGPAAIVGWSWGAMLALSFAARYPALVESVALVGCGTYNVVSRGEYHRVMRERLGAAGTHEYDELERQLGTGAHRRLASLAGLGEYDESERQFSRTDDDVKRDELLAALGRLAARAQAVDPIEVDEVPPLPADARGAEETWTDAMRLQTEGTEPAIFSAIVAPVLVLHGDSDPHPGQAIRQVLARHIRGLEYVELASCGHTPWLERIAREPFLDALRRWLRTHS
jgi:pimeloyl-ACP methyl ester carboxylesterase